MTDTRRKRSAALNFGPIPGIVLPDADGSIDASDRAQLVGGYYWSASGVLTPFPPSNRIARVEFRSRIARYVRVTQ